MGEHEDRLLAQTTKRFHEMDQKITQLDLELGVALGNMLKISVTERLPRECWNVLVFEYDPGEDEYFPGIGFIGVDHQWYVASFAGRFEPTHWVDMELR